MGGAAYGSVAVVFSCFIAVTYSTGHFENVAQGKVCDSSPRHDASPLDGAVNNNTDGYYPAKFPNPPNCIHTDGRDTSPWWEVNLGRPYPVYSITVWARTMLERRMEGCVISVDGAECYRFNYTPVTRQLPITCTGGVLNGTVVRVSKNIGKRLDKGDHVINICEFQVFSCSDAYWGSGCDKECGHCSDGEVCDKVTGHCSSCSPGWKQTPLCDQECEDGKYGSKCRMTCSEGCQDVCGKAKGNCTCEPGWQGQTCDTECEDGKYGSKCRETCSEGCEDVCGKAEGNCTCKPDWQGQTCDTECDPGTYGAGCRQTCGQCQRGEVCHQGNGSCSACTGHLLLPLCKVCADGSYGATCEGTCSQQCSNVCDKVTGFCTCNAGWKLPLCDQAEEQQGQTSETNVWPIVGPVIGVGLCIIIAIIVAVRWLRTRRSASRGDGDERANTTTSTVTTGVPLELPMVTQEAGPEDPSDPPSASTENAYEFVEEDPPANYDKVQMYQNTRDHHVYSGL